MVVAPNAGVNGGVAESNRGSTSAIPSEDSGTNESERVLRIISLSLITLLVAAGLIGLLGVRSSLATVSAEGISLSVEHAAVTRAGLATPFGLVIESTDGSPLPQTLTTRVGAKYLALFDENGLDPEPTRSFQSSDWTWWTFEVPDGASELEVSFDARLEPAVQWGRSTTAAVEIEGREVVSVAFRTWVLP